MAAAQLSRIPGVDIDPDGVFKYVLVRVRPARGAGPARDVVRGHAWAEYHADIYDKTAAEIEKQGYDCECLGGGRISHQSKEKKIHVYGYSVVEHWMYRRLPCICTYSTGLQDVALRQEIAA